MPVDVDTPNFARTLREMCGDYHPEATEEEKRFVLPVDGEDVPVFVYGTEKARYPEIRIFPYLDDEHTYMGRAYGLSLGDPDEGEFADVTYRRGRTDTTLRKIISHIEIYGKSRQQVTRIRDHLFRRMERFRLVEACYVVDQNGWEEDGNVYINAKYDSDLGIFRVYDLETRLIKTPNVDEIAGSWNITEDGLIVNPITDIENISLGQIVNGGYSFYNGDLLPNKGIMSFKITRSKPEPDENGPDIPKWVIHIQSKYKDVMEFKVGKGYAKVNVDDKEE